MLDLGNKVVCIDNFDLNYSREVKNRNLELALANVNFELIEGNINHPEDLKKCFRGEKPDTVIHLAAKSGIRPSLGSPEEYYTTNVFGTLNVLEAMRNFDVKRLIFASSSSVYGNNKKVPFVETDNVDAPISPYAATKKASELLCHTYHHLYDFDIFCLRFFTVYGPRQRPDLAIHKFTEHILNDKPIEMFGDGSTARDYTYISDIIKGIVSSVDKLKGYEIINLGESNVISLKHLISSLEKHLNKTAIIKKQPMQPGDVVNTYANIDKANKILGYNPTWKFEEGIKEFIKWKLS